MWLWSIRPARQLPSPKRAPVAEVQRLLALYRDRYPGFNVRHFHQLARPHHGVSFGYAFVKNALQSAGGKQFFDFREKRLYVAYAPLLTGPLSARYLQTMFLTLW